MTTETMTIHKALSEVKILNSRIEKEINSNNYCMRIKSADKTPDIKEDIKADYQRVIDLINRRKALKKAITLSNANTEIEIAGVKYKVAEAIELKNTGLEFERILLNTLSKQYTKVINDLETLNRDIETAADNYIIGLYGSKELKTNSKEIEETRNLYIEKKKYEFVDPVGIKSQIDALTEYISKFESEIDSALSTSNALTIITIEY